jgi:hypothetical protein
MVSFLSPLVVLEIPRERILLADLPWRDGNHLVRSSLRPLPQTSSPPPPQHSIYTDTPNDNNTLITLVAMGLPRNMYLTERCVRSIRARGNFTGTIMIFTDDRGMQQYQRTLMMHDHKILLVMSKPEDRHPKYDNGTRVQFTKHTMKYKRFKTLSTKYLQKDYPELSWQIEYILYLDIDNVVTNPLSLFFQDYQRKINQEYAIHDVSSHSLISFWMDAENHNGRTMLQGGQFMLQKNHGQECLDAWRNEMDSVPSDLDQPLLMRVAEQFDRYRCVVSLLPDGPKGKQHFALLDRDILAATKPEQYPTIVHISGKRAKSFSEQVQRQFLRNALDLSPKLSKGSLEVGVPWEDVIQPIGVKGQQPKEWY